MDFFWKNGKYLLPILITVFFLWYFLQNDEKYLKRKTKELILLASFSSPLSELKTISRINKITDLLSIDVLLKAEFQEKKRTVKNIQEVKSFLFPYFLQTQNARWDIEHLTVNLENKTKNNKTAFVSLTVKGTFNNKNLQCNVSLKWKKKRKWLINHIQVFSCLSSALL